jgi:hypothetical protein
LGFFFLKKRGVAFFRGLAARAHGSEREAELTADSVKSRRQFENDRVNVLPLHVRQGTFRT